MSLDRKQLIEVCIMILVLFSLVASTVKGWEINQIYVDEQRFWLEAAKIAWGYFKPGVGVSPSTGLNYASLNWHRLTDWDLGIYISALIAARNLGILGVEGEWGFNERVGKVLKFLSERPLSPNGIPYWSYDADSGRFPSEGYTPPADFGRLLLALDDLRKVNPEWIPQINFIISRYNVSALANSEYFAGNGVYEHYSAQGYLAFNFNTPALRALSDLGGGNFVNLYGVSLPRAWITSEVLILAVLEGRAAKEYKGYLDGAFEAQKRRYENEGILTAFSEGAYPPPYGYVYEWIVTGDGETWVLWSNGKVVKAPEAIFTKVAYSFYAIYEDDYSKRLVGEVKNLATERGFLEGITVDGKTLNILTDKTNAMILEAAAYALSSLPSAAPNELPTELNEAEGKVFKAFKAIVEAERKGGNVSSLVAELNSAIMLLERARSLKDEDLMKKALVKLDEISMRALEVGEQGAAAARWKRLSTTAALTIEASIALITYIYAPQAFWRVWAKLKGKWRVKAVEKR